jgi:hypothetical protein
LLEKAALHRDHERGAVGQGEEGDFERGGSQGSGGEFSGIAGGAGAFAAARRCRVAT